MKLVALSCRPACLRMKVCKASITYFKHVTTFRSCFEFLQKVFLGLMYPFFVCALGDFLVFFALVLRQIARYLPHHRSENASKTHPKSSHDKFKTASK